MLKGRRPVADCGPLDDLSPRRALCFLTRRDSVLYLPTKQNFVLLLSTAEPDQLLAALAK
ncbi:MAG: hypothetical protein ABW061_09235 [Polyangiaceae bacterium]